MTSWNQYLAEDCSQAGRLDFCDNIATNFNVYTMLTKGWKGP